MNKRLMRFHGGLWQHPDFLRMFTFPMVSGDNRQGLTSGKVLLSVTAAQKYFGNARAEGQVIEIVGNIRKLFTVVGVFKDVPPNSHLQFDMLLPVGLTTE